MPDVFEDMGYRRYEWKCYVLNAAARRLDFPFEGGRQAAVQRSRDTAWFSIIDDEWPRCAAWSANLPVENADIGLCASVNH